MCTTIFTNYLSSLKYDHKSSQFQHPHQIIRFHCTCVQASEEKKGCSRTKTNQENKVFDVDNAAVFGVLKRRTAIVSGASLVTTTLLGFPRDGLAVLKQGLLAGRIPGLSEPDEQGWRTYRRPDEKSGGHGVGWSPIIPYLFSVPQGWEEVPVSIADLGGTEIDLRFANSQEGRLFVIVAPVLRFADSKF
ncbi:hypothetical protein AQUCO_01400357v1 [Aquilegia coerulea]|uniref:PsbP C-terminal domain-containing protein n=1 Tax=Aquilegia coerulea TaxID=218851 RepID=A0A2G5DW10_AQUCA|nr:hypothetical protein AQUCO_01400357v1 [Aquilegia coerulea]